MGKTRDLRFDNIKGVLIILVVVGHYLWGYKDATDATSIVVRLIYLFHMPAFIFVSGYFSKDSLPISWRGIAELLVSYFIVNTTMMAFVVTCKGSDVALLSPYYSCWYLLALVFWRISLPFFAKYRFALVLSILVSLAVGFSSEITNKFALARTIAFYPFFIGGFLFKKSGFVNRLSSKSLPQKTAGIVVFAATMVVAYFAIVELGIKTGDEMMQAYRGDLSLDFTRRVIVLALAAVATLSLLAAMPSRRIPLLTLWGKNSLTIYLFHRFFPLIMLAFMPASGFDWTYLIAGAVFSFVTLAVLGCDAVEGRYRAFVKSVVGVLFASQDDRRAWNMRQAIVLVVACVAMAAMLAQAVLD